MASGKIILRGSVTGLPAGPGGMYPPAVLLTNPVLQIKEVVLAAGDNVITIPVGATVCCITPPPDNTIALALGVGGTEHIAPNIFLLRTFPASTPASMIINAASLFTNPVEFRFM